MQKPAPPAARLAEESAYRIRGILNRGNQRGVRAWEQLSPLLLHLEDPHLALRALHRIRKWGQLHSGRLQEDLVLLLGLRKWWDVLPGSPWTPVAHLLGLTLLENLVPEHRERVLPLLESRDPLVRERAARLLKKLGWRPTRRVEMARDVVAKRNLKAVQHLGNKMPRALRTVMPAERFVTWKGSTLAFVPADDAQPDLAFALQALSRIPPSGETLELLLELHACSTAHRQEALRLLEQVPATDPLWQMPRVKVRLRRILQSSWLPQARVLDDRRERLWPLN